MRYLDASALVKLVVSEPESAALEAWLGDSTDDVSCALARTEVPRAVASQSQETIARGDRLLERTTLVTIDDDLLDRAGRLEGTLRSLDAIHVAAALSLGDALDVLVTYDVRMARAAEAHGLRVVTPR